MDFLLSSFMDKNLYAMEGEDKDEKQRHQDGYVLSH